MESNCEREFSYVSVFWCMAECACVSLSVCIFVCCYQGDMSVYILYNITIVCVHLWKCASCASIYKSMYSCACVQVCVEAVWWVNKNEDIHLIPWFFFRWSPSFSLSLTHTHTDRQRHTHFCPFSLHRAFEVFITSQQLAAAASCTISPSRRKLLFCDISVLKKRKFIWPIWLSQTAVRTLTRKHTR